MRSSTSYIGRIGRIGWCLGLSLCLTQASAQGLLAFKKQPTAEQLPPAVKASPTMLNPRAPLPAVSPPSASSPMSPAIAQPSAVTQTQQGQLLPLATTQMVDPLTELAEKKVFSAELLAQTTPVTRAQLAEVMVKALEHSTAITSEFPVYRDVPLEHPFYPYIEVAREKKLMEYPEGHGFYHPDQPITFGELYQAISHAITGHPPAPQRANYLLRNIPEQASFPVEERNAMAKMAQSRFFIRTWRYQTVFKPLRETVTPEALAPFISYMMFLNQRRTPLSGNAEVVTQLPAGLKLFISPATGILEDRLKAGGRLRFQLVSAVEAIPRTSNLLGVVEESLPDRTYRILFNNVRTPDGQVYETRAQLSISFSTRDKLGFIVPGETFEVITQAVIPQFVPPSGPVPPMIPGQTGVPAQTAPSSQSTSPQTPNPSQLRQPFGPRTQTP